MQKSSLLWKLCVEKEGVMARKPKKNTTGYTTETTVLPNIITEEERYNLDKDDTVVQYEMNLIELPFFSRDDRAKENVAKKYIFSENQYVHVIPGNLEECGRKIPQDFDEKIFYAILRLYRKGSGRRIVTTFYELLTLAGFKLDGGKDYIRAKESIHRLRGTTYECSNILYNAEKTQRISDKRYVQILQSARIVKLEDLSNSEKEEIKDRLKDSMKEVVVVELSDFIEQNILAKGFLYYDAVKLLNIDNATARKMYIMLEKWRGREKTDTVKRSCRFIASRLPLSWEQTNIPGTINVIEKAASELRGKGMIGEYEIERSRPLRDSVITFYFSGAAETARIKRMEYENRILNVSTGHENLEIKKTDESIQLTFAEFEVKNDSFSLLISILPFADRTAFNRELLTRYLGSKGKDYVESNIKYCIENAKDFSKMLPAALENDYAEKQRLLEIEKRKAEEEKKRLLAEEQSKKDDEEKIRLGYEAWAKNSSIEERVEVDLIAKKMMSDQKIPETLQSIAIVTFRVMAWQEKEKAEEWYSSISLDEKEQIFAKFQKKFGIIKQLHALDPAESLQYRRLVFTLFSEK